MFDCRGQAWRPTGDDSRHVYDVVGIGFGPSGLALGIAIEEHNAAVGPERAVTATFVERQPRFGWHRGMLLPGTTMQVSFLKDLATMRNPHSTFSFVSYLHAQDRLVDFINGKSLFPSRIEFHGYLEWVAERLDAPRRLRHGGRRRPPRARRRHRRRLRRRRPRRQRHPRAQHRRRDRPDPDAAGRHRALRPRLAHLRAAAAARASSATSAAPLRRRRRRPERRRGDRAPARPLRRPRRSARSSRATATAPPTTRPFANQIFDPAAVDTFYDATADAKRMLVDYHANTNYSVVDLELIQELYRRAYQEKVRGAQRLRFDQRLARHRRPRDRRRRRRGHPLARRRRDLDAARRRDRLRDGL